MARLRTLHPKFFVNEKLAELNPLCRLLFQGLWCIADRDGRLEDRPKRIKIEILPYDDDADIENYLDQLHEAGFIIRYEAAGERYIQVVSFAKHQTPHIKEKASTIPAPCMPGTCTVQAGKSSLHAPPESGILSLESGIRNPGESPPHGAGTMPGSEQRAPDGELRDGDNLHMLAEACLAEIERRMQSRYVGGDRTEWLVTITLLLSSGIPYEKLLVIHKAWRKEARRTAYTAKFFRQDAPDLYSRLLEAEAAKAEKASGGTAEDQTRLEAQRQAGIEEAERFRRRLEEHGDDARPP